MGNERFPVDNGGLPSTLDTSTPAVFQGRRIGNAGDVYNNALKDLKDMGTGAIALGNLGMARGYDLIPQPGYMPQPLLRNGDLDTIQKVGREIANQYKQNYLDPITSGKPGDLAKYAAAHPVNFGLDVAPVAKVAQVGKLSGYASELAAKIPAVAKAQEIANAAAESAGLTAEVASDLPVGPAAQMTPAIKGGVQVFAEAVAEKAPALQEASKVVQDALQKVNANQQVTAMKQAYEGNVLAENVAIGNKLGKAWHKIPKELRDQVRPYAEGHHPELLAGKKAPDAIREYLEVAEEFSGKMRDRIKHFVPDQDFGLEKYQPATMKRLGLTKEQYTALSPADRAKVLSETKIALDKLGINPQYSPHVNPEEVVRTLANPGAIKGSIKNKPLDVQNQNFLKEKTATGEYATESHFDAMRTRWIQIGQLHNAYEQLVKGAIKQSEQVAALADAIDEAVATGSKELLNELEASLVEQGLKPISGEAVVNSVLGGLEGSVISADEVAHLSKTLLPEKLYMPEAFAEALNKMVAADKASKLGKWLGKFNNLCKRYMLGGNMTYPEAQAVQAAPMLELVSMNGPITALHSAMAYAMLFNKKAREAVPLSIAENVLAAQNDTTRYLEIFANRVLDLPGVNKLPAGVKKAAAAPLKLYDDLVDFTLKRNAIYDNLLRAKAAIQFALDDNSPVTKAMWKTSEAAAELEKFFDDPAKLEAAAATVNERLGDFQALSNSTTGKVLGKVTLFPSWFMFITQYTARLPVQNPFKTAIMAKLGQVSEQYLGDPNVPEYLKGAVRVAATGPNGQPQVAWKSGANPLASVPELASIINAVAQGDTDESAVTMLVPFAQLAFIYTAHLNPSTRQPYKDPSLLTTRDGKSYRYRALQDGLKLEAVESFPNLGTQILEQMFPPLTRSLERFIEKARSGGERSVMTDIFKSAPKTYSPGGGITAMRQAPTWATMAIQEVINNKPVEYNPMARVTAQRQRLMQSKELWRKFAKTDTALQNLMK